MTNAPSFSRPTMLGVFCIWGLLGGSTYAQLAVGLQEGEISYVLEPFVWFNESEWVLQPRDSWNATLEVEEALFGDSALRLDFDLTATAIEVGVVQPRTPHNCHGSSHLSLWYKLLLLQPADEDGSDVQARLMVLDDDGDSNLNASFLPEAYYADFPTIAPSSSEQDWQELRVEWKDLQLADSAFVGNGQLDLHRLRGWKVELTGRGSGTLLLDHLSCIGGSDMIAASLHTGGDWDRAVSDGIWQAQWYQSEAAHNQSRFVFDNNGTLGLDYAVAMTESWGGFTDLGLFAPGPAYYNLSRINCLHLGYRIRRAATRPSRSHLRIMLADSSHVCANCTGDDETVEWWYNFNYVLDDANGTVGAIEMPLVGSATNSSMPFWLTGWAGQVGNRRLDLESIKGFNFQISMDSQGDMGSMVAGAIDLFDFSGFQVDHLAAQQSVPSIIETDVIFLESPRFHRGEFLSSHCQETCADDPTCLYAFIRGDNCFTAGHLEASDIGIPNTVTLQEDVTTFWMDDATKRGNFCDLCDCQESNQHIDCRDRDLYIAPKVYDLPWKPRSLDLRNNPKLVFLGKGSLDQVGESLEELWLPQNMSFVSKECLESLPRLTALHKSEDDTEALLPWINAIVDTQQAFSDVCCSIGDHIGMNQPSSGISFCDMRVKEPGVDSTYFPFTKFDEATTWATVRPSSKFMAEAAESPQKCAEYCSISKECNYFAYDGRIQNAEHICYLLSDGGTGASKVCCEEDHFANEEKTLPGWTSGLPPRTRHTVDDARVLIEPHTIAIETSPEGHGEAYFDLRLGSNPLRGAVWIEPEMVQSFAAADVVFDPPRAVLYDRLTTVRVRVKISAAPDQNAFALAIHNRITSCDLSFVEFEDESTDTNVFVEVSVPQAEEEDDRKFHLAIAAVVCGMCILCVGFLFYIWRQRKKRQMDTVWIIRKQEIIFPEIPVILGRGSFGLVLKAEYRGSEVAVKQALPQPNLRSSNLRSSKRARDLSDSDSQFLWTSSASSEEISAIGALRASAQSMEFSSVKVDRQSWSRMKKNFMAEMRLLSKLRHPAITTTMGAVLGREPMLVMELMHHGSLYDLLHNETVGLDPEMVLPLLLDISQGIRFLHSSDVIHGDLKAANVLVDSRFRAKVSDFGGSAKKGRTGTPQWMAPELILGTSFNTPATDAYAFGMLLNEVYSRKDPYEDEGLSMGEILNLVADPTISKRPRTPRNMPAPVASVMIECFVHDPEERPTFEEIDKRLKRVNVKSLDGSARESKNVSLFDIFPKAVAEALRDGRDVEATQTDCATIFFSDIVGFTDISSELEPRKVADMLGRLYTKFDELSHKHQIYKVETIGDAYMAVANLVEDQESDHVQRIAQFSIDAIAAAKTVPIDLEDLEKGCVSIRVGFHCGSVVADVVGTRNPRYCLFGDAVNTASRMESSGEAGRIHCSTVAAALLEHQCQSIPLNSRGTISVKGKGNMHTYWVNEEGFKPSQDTTTASKALEQEDIDLSGLDYFSSHTVDLMVGNKKGSGRWRNEDLASVGKGSGRFRNEDVSLSPSSGHTFSFEE